MFRSTCFRSLLRAVRKSKDVKILFLHGWGSVVGGVKPTYLKTAGHEVLNPALDHDDFAAALHVAQAEYERARPDVVVGSSRGGAVAMNLQSSDTPLVLLCPAWKNWGIANRLKSNSVILHSRLDDVIPFADSEQLIQQSGLPAETLIEVGSDHRLADESSLAVMLWACELLGSGGRLLGLGADSATRTSADSEVSATTQAEGSYICDGCGEEIVIPLDASEGTSQSYVEDCPVCCRANLIHVQLDEDGSAQVWAEPEQDND